MDDNQSPEERLTREFKSLGKNLVDALRTAWERPERRGLQSEIEAGLKEFSDTIKREAQGFTNSPAGQQVKADIEQLGEEIRSGETTNKVKQELIQALQTANTELEKIINSWTSSAPGEQTENSQTTSESEPDGQ